MTPEEMAALPEIPQAVIDERLHEAARLHLSSMAIASLGQSGAGGEDDEPDIGDDLDAAGLHEEASV